MNMSTISKILIGIVVLCVAAFGIAFLTSRYLVSKLDGTGGVQAPAEYSRYESSEFDLAFSYPSSYEIQLHKEGSAEREWHTLVFLPKGYIPPQGGEGPATIVVQHIPNPEGASLEDWVKGDSRSNWKLAAEGATLEPVTVGGQVGVRYQHSGLYETDAVAVAYGGAVYLFSVSWLTPQDQNRAQFDQLLSAVEFL